DNLKKQGWSVFYRFGENLKQVTFIILINQNTQFAQWSQIFINFTHSVENGFIVGIRHLQKLYTPVTQVGYSFNDIRCSQGHVLYTFPVIKFQELFYLAFLFTLRRFVDREFNVAVAV